MMESLAAHLWCPWLLGLTMVVGLIYSAGSGFFPIFGCKLWIRTTLGSLLQPRSKAGISPVQALATALASTIGTGSIAGVAAALSLGGPGAVFWLWLAALLGMMTSCAEKILAVAYQRAAPDGTLRGGPMYYLRDGLHSPFLAGWFALCCIPACLVGGNLIQSSSIADTMQSVFGTSRLTTGLFLCALAAPVLLGGIGRIARFSTVLVPVMALLYLGGGIAVLVLRREQLPNALCAIFRCALSPNASFGGAAGWSLSLSLRHGVARGIFAGESGLGTSAIAHGAVKTDSPARQGMWGILEVFCSTLLVCTVTALTILVSSPDLTVPGGAHTTAAAFSRALGPAGGFIVCLSLILFAFSSILGWSWYGQQALEYLTGGTKYVPVYRLTFLFCILMGALLPSARLWAAVDVWDALMAFPNLIALLLFSPRILGILHRWLSVRT